MLAAPYDLEGNLPLTSNTVSQTDLSHFTEPLQSHRKHNFDTTMCKIKIKNVYILGNRRSRMCTCIFRNQTHSRRSSHAFQKWSGVISRHSVLNTVMRVETYKVSVFRSEIIKIREMSGW